MEFLQSLWGSTLGDHVITVLVLFLMGYVVFKSIPKNGGKGDSQQ